MIVLKIIIFRRNYSKQLDIAFLWTLTRLQLPVGTSELTYSRS